MQLIRAAITAGLLLLFGTIVPGYTQHDKQDEKHGKSERQQGSQQHGGAPSAAQPQRSQAQQQPQAHGRQQQDPPQGRQHGPQQQQQQRVQQPQHRVQPPQQQRVQPAQPQRPPQQQGQRSQQARQQQKPHRTQQEAVSWQHQKGWLKQGGWQGHGTWQQGRAQHWEREHRTWGQRGGYGGYYIPQDRFRLYFGSQHWFRMHSRPTIYMGYPRFAYGGFSFLLVDPWPEYWAENWYATDDVYVDYDDGYYLCNRRYPRVRLAITVAM